MDYFIIVVTTAAGILFHAWLFVLFRRWADRDLALSIAGNDPERRSWMLERLEHARRQKVRRRDLQAWLEREAAQAPVAMAPDAREASAARDGGN